MATVDKKEDQKTATLAPQPGQEDNKQADSSDALLVFIISVGKFFSSIFRVSFLSYFFWTGCCYMVGATLMLIGIRTLAPQIYGKCACPIRNNGYMFVILWYLMAIINILTAYCYTTVLSMSEQDFEHMSTYIKVIGFFVKVVPTYSRLIHIFNFCQLDVMAAQIVFLPECNNSALVLDFGVIVLLWWAIVFIGVWCKRRIFVPPFIYEPLRPSTSLAIELQKLMRSFGP